MTTPPERCRTCDGTGYVETAAPDSRVIHHESCPDCAAARNPECDAGRRLWETLHASLGVEGYLDHWWQFAWDELPGELHDELVDAARRLGQSERAACLSALVNEDAALLRHQVHWRSTAHQDCTAARIFWQGGRAALHSAARRYGVTDLHARAADVVARGAPQEGQEGQEP